MNLNSLKNYSTWNLFFKKYVYVFWEKSFINVRKYFDLKSDCIDISPQSSEYIISFHYVVLLSNNLRILFFLYFSCMQ